MKPLLYLIAGVIYVLSLICLAAVSFLPIGVWRNASGEAGYAWDIPVSAKIVCFTLLIVLSSGGSYFLWRSFAK